MSSQLSESSPGHCMPLHLRGVILVLGAFSPDLSQLGHLIFVYNYSLQSAKQLEKMCFAPFHLV